MNSNFIEKDFDKFLKENSFDTTKKIDSWSGKTVYSSQSLNDINYGWEKALKHSQFSIDSLKEYIMSEESNFIIQDILGPDDSLDSLRNTSYGLCSIIDSFIKSKNDGL